MRAKATKTVAAQNMARRAERLLSGARGGPRRRTRSRACGSPSRRPAARRRSRPTGLSQDLRLAGGLHRRRPGDRPREQGRRARPQRRRQDDAAAHPRRASRSPTPARSAPGTGSSSATTRRSTRRSTSTRTVVENLQVRRARPHRDPGALGARLVPVLGRRRRQARPRAVRRREDPARARGPRRLQRQRAAARRADEQPRPGVARGDPRGPARLRRAPSSWCRTTRAPSRRSTRSGCCCCPTATRTCGARRTWTSSRWPSARRVPSARASWASIERVLERPRRARRGGAGRPVPCARTARSRGCPGSATARRPSAVATGARRRGLRPPARSSCSSRRAPRQNATRPPSANVHHWNA